MKLDPLHGFHAFYVGREPIKYGPAPNYRVIQALKALPRKRFLAMILFHADGRRRDLVYGADYYWVDGIDLGQGSAEQVQALGPRAVVIEGEAIPDGDWAVLSASLMAQRTL